MDKQIEHEIEMAKADMEQLSKEDLVDELLQTQLENNKLREKVKELKEYLKKSRSINTTHRKQKAELRKEIKQLKTDNKELMSADKQLEFHCNYYKCYYDFLTAETPMTPDKDFIRDWCLEHGLGFELRKKLIASIL